MILQVTLLLHIQTTSSEVAHVLRPDVRGGPLKIGLHKKVLGSKKLEVRKTRHCFDTSTAKEMHLLGWFTASRKVLPLPKSPNKLWQPDGSHPVGATARAAFQDTTYNDEKSVTAVCSKATKPVQSQLARWSASVQWLLARSAHYFCSCRWRWKLIGILQTVNHQFTKDG